MLIKRVSDPFEKLAILGDENRFERAGDRPQDEATIRFGDTYGREQVVEVAGVKSCITEVTTPGGKKPVLKAMMTTACEKNCYYCPFRAGRAMMNRITFSPDELALAFDRLQRAGLVDGIFLSSGIIKGGVTTQDKIIDTVEIIRNKYQYRGYVHLKIMPGAEYDQLVQAIQLADRISINLEGPTQERLTALAPKKDLTGDLLQRMQWAGEIKREIQSGGGVRRGTYRHNGASIVTQYVVGAVGDTDLELLTMTQHLHRNVGLTRAYFSAFNPVEQTPFENLTPTPAIREFRLYQASFLLRDYGWDLEDLPFEGMGDLPYHVDPKQAWADEHLREHPVEINTAARTVLLRVPGIGPVSADTIIAARRRGRLHELSHLRAIGLRGIERMAPYILLDGYRPPHQLAMFG